MSQGPRARARALTVLVDGAPLPEAEALALWDRFSTWMEDHRGDLKGFAAQEGFASVHPGVDGDRPVLRASKTAEQRPYAPVTAAAGGADGARKDHPRGDSAGSAARQNGGRKPDRQAGNPRDSAGKRRK